MGEGSEKERMEDPSDQEPSTGVRDASLSPGNGATMTGRGKLSTGGARNLNSCNSGAFQ